MKRVLYVALNNFTVLQFTESLLMAQLEKMAYRVTFLSQNPVVGKVAKLDVIVFKSIF